MIGSIILIITLGEWQISNAMMVKSTTFKSFFFSVEVELLFGRYDIQHVQTAFQTSTSCNRSMTKCRKEESTEAEFVTGLCSKNDYCG